VKRPLEDVDDIPDELKKQKGDPDAPEQDDTKYTHIENCPKQQGMLSSCCQSTLHEH
jgi:hypothetical protein